ncbi:SRPBCC domain-containing protein [Paenibacillus sp. MCAF9]|uniref:SRPBCC domain-containing protein n=1 Tax=Paenibacillus sp. MCAF9 TaxID=3233046 RepID=UPI003F9DE879
MKINLWLLANTISRGSSCFELGQIDHVSGHEFRIKATFESIEGSTRVTFRQRFKEKEEFEKSKPICIEANEQLLDKLGELLENLTD